MHNRVVAASSGYAGMTHVLETGLWWVMQTVSIHWFWLKHQSNFNCKLGPLSDPLQAGDWLFPPSQKWPDKLTHVTSLHFLPSGQYGWCFGYCFSGLLPLCSDKGQVTFFGAFSGSPYSFKLCSEIGQIHLRIEAQCDHLFSLGDHHKDIVGISIEIICYLVQIWNDSNTNHNLISEAHCKRPFS